MIKHFPILPVLLASSTLMALDGQALNGQVQNDQALPACEGIGIYRSFTLARQFKLAAAYFVNPSLPERVRILNAYSLEKAIQLQGDKEAVAERIESAEMELALPVNDEGVWVPAPLPPYMSHCRPSTTDVFGDETVAFTRVSAPAKADELTVWLGDLSLEDAKKFYVLSENDLDSGTDDRFITWDPDEFVTAVR